MVEQPRLSDVEAKLCRMVRDIIEESLQYNWLHRTAKPIIDIGLSQEVGATDAIIFRANVNIELFVKFHPENATRENNGYNILLQGPNEFTSHLVPPLPTRGNIPLWLTPLVDATTLHDLACRPGKSAQFDQWLRRLYEDFFSASDHSSCTLHGDEHAKNIMVFRNAIGHNPTGWVIVDYVNAKKEADWIFSIAKMLFWWQFYCVLELAKQDSSIRETLKAAYDTEELKHNRLIITYDEKELERQVPARCRDLQQMVLTFAQTIAAAFGEDPMEFHQRLKLALFSVIFASAPIHFGKADFVVPIMIGESLKHL